MKYDIIKDGQVVGEAIFHTSQAITITLKQGTKFDDIKGPHIKCEAKGGK